MRKRQRMRTPRRWRGKALLAASLLVSGPSAGWLFADDFGAKQNGNWEDSATWVTSGFNPTPGSSDNVYIGGDYPAGASTGPVSVTLGADESAYGLTLGYDNGGQGTLDLNGHAFSAWVISIGDEAGTTGTIARTGGGSITANTLAVDHGNTFSFGGSDSVMNLEVYGGASVTTAATGNLAASPSNPYDAPNVTINGGTLNLGADLSISQAYYYPFGGGTLSVDDGGAVHGGGHSIDAIRVSLGASGGSWTLDGYSSLRANSLDVAHGALTLGENDSAYYLSVGAGGTVTLGQDYLYFNEVSVNDGGTLDLGGHTLYAYNLELGTNSDGSTWTLANRGSISTSFLGVANGSLTLESTDGVYQELSVGHDGNVTLGLGTYVSGISVDRGGVVDAGGNDLTLSSLNLGVTGEAWTLSNYNLISTNSLSIGSGSLTLGVGDSTRSLSVTGGAVVTTTATSNVAADPYSYASADARIDGGTLNLGADLDLTNPSYSYYGGVLAIDNGGLVDVGGHSIKAVDVELGTTLGGTWTLGNYTTLDTQTLAVNNGVMLLTAAENVTDNLRVGTGGDVTLTKDLSLIGTLAVDNGGVLDAAGHDLNVNDVRLGYDVSGPWTLDNRGTITTAGLGVAHGALTLGASDVVTNNLQVGSGGTVTAGSDLNLSSWVSVGDNLYEGLGATLDMAGHALGAYSIQLGNYYGSGGDWTLANQGTLTAQYLEVYGGSLALGAGDAIGSLGIHNTAAVTTDAATSLTDNVLVDGAASLTVHGDLNLTGYLLVGSNYGSYPQGGTLEMTGHNINAQSVQLGMTYFSSFTLADVGTITTADLGVAHGALTLGASDVVTSNLHVGSGGTVTLGSDLNLSGWVSVGDYFGEGLGATLDMAGHALGAYSIELGNYYGSGVAWTLANQGTLTAQSLDVYGGSLALGAGDAIGSLGVYSGATVTTFATSNVSGGVDLNGYQTTLSLGADLNVSGTVSVGDGGTLDAQNHAITASAMNLSSYSNPYTVANLGTLTLGSLSMTGGSLALHAGDTVGNLYLDTGASLTTASTGNVTAGVSLDGYGTMLTLGADLSTTGGSVYVTSGAMLDAQGHDLTVQTLSVGYFGYGAAALVDVGAVHATDLYLGQGSTLTLTSGRDTIENQIYLAGDGTNLTVQQEDGQLTGLTLNGAYASALAFDAGATLALNLATDETTGWIFRWADASGDNWISLIHSEILAGQILVNGPGGYKLLDFGGYTYIAGVNFNPVPEPSSMVLVGLGVGGLAWRGRRRRRQEA